MRVAFGIIGGEFWTGGLNYLENLLSAIADHSSLGLEPILCVGTDADIKLIDRFSKYLQSPPVVSHVWNKSRISKLYRNLPAHLIQKDILAEREFLRVRTDVVFQHSCWLGFRFKIPTLAWVADLQHLRRPEMFFPLDRFRRNIGYTALSLSASRILVSSQDAKSDFEHFYPKSIGRIDAVPFSVKQVIGDFDLGLLQNVVQQYSIPNKFFFLPNQLWKHKNHRGVIEALKKCTVINPDLVVIACGNPKDYRHPDHPDSLFSLIKKYGLQERFRFLGLIPYAHLVPLMRLSIGVINPSFHEGWSTTVEEAKVLAVPLLLSNISIHREQAESTGAVFFNPDDSDDISRVLSAQWKNLSPGPRPAAEKIAIFKNQFYREKFAREFAASAAKAIY